MEGAIDKMQEKVAGWAEDVKRNAGLLVFLGIVTVVAGFIALMVPFVSGIGIVLLIGGALVLGGMARIIGAFSAGSFGRGTIAFIGGVLTLLAGVLVLARPGLGMATLTLIIGGYLLVDGIFGAVLSFQIRPAQGWGWMLFSAMCSLLLGVLLLADWPLTGFWAIGTLVGVNLLFAGVALVSVGATARRIAKGAQTRQEERKLSTHEA